MLPSPHRLAGDSARSNGCHHFPCPKGPARRAVRCSCRSASPSGKHQPPSSRKRWRGCGLARTRYSNGRGEAAVAISAICDHYSRRTGRDILAEQVIFTSGTQNALCAAMLTLASLGDEVIVPEPYYVTYDGVDRRDRCRPGAGAAHARDRFSPVGERSRARHHRQEPGAAPEQPLEPHRRRAVARGNPGDRRSLPAERSVDRLRRGLIPPWSSATGASPRPSTNRPGRAYRRRLVPVEITRHYRTTAPVGRSDLPNFGPHAGNIRR